MLWTSRESTGDYSWHGVAYGNGTFAAVGRFQTDGVMTSPDGIEWTSQTPVPASAWSSVVFGGDTFVAVSSDGADSGATKVMTSPDGITWTPRTAAGDELWTSVAYGNDTFVAVATRRFNLGKAVRDQVMRSTNGGETWTLIRPFNADPTNGWSSVAFGDVGGGTFVAVSSFGTGDVMTSPDGITWTLHTTTPAVAYSSVTYGDGRFVAVGSNGAVMTSPDGVTWTSQTAAAGYGWTTVAYGDGLFVAVTSKIDVDGNQVMSSPDGIDWTLHNSSTDNSWRSVAYGDGQWVAVGVSGTGNRVMSGVAVEPPVPPVLPVPPVPTGPLGPTLSVECEPTPLVIGDTVACTVAGGDPNIDVLWRASYGTVFAEAGVTLDESGVGEFAFVVPAAALGQEVTVELVEWLAPTSLGVVGGPVPTSVPSGEGPTLPGWLAMVGLVALVGTAVATQRRQVVGG
jgi:hypothetical protein